MQRTIALDVETTKIPFFRPWQREAFLVSIGITAENGWKKTWVLNHEDLDDIPNQRKLLNEVQHILNRSERIVGHNLKFDLQWLWHVGLKTDHLKLYCTQVAQYLLERQRRQSYKLNEVAKYYGITEKVDMVAKFWASGCDTYEIPLKSILNPYLEQDCFTTLAIYQRQVKRIKEMGIESLISVQMELMGILAEMEYNGAEANRDLCQHYVNYYHNKLEEIDKNIYEIAGREFNIGSTDHLSAVLFGGIIKKEGEEFYISTRKCYEKRPYPFVYSDPKRPPTIKYRKHEMIELVGKTRKCIIEEKVEGMFKVPKGVKELDKGGYWSVDKSTLAQLKGRKKEQKQLVALLKERSAVAKTLETFSGKQKGSGLINKIGSDGRIHPSFNQTIAATGRLTSSDPNGQNFPRKGTSPVKEIFVPRFDKILNADLAQLEWRVAAFLSQDPVAMYEIKHDVDYHRDNAIKFFNADPSLPNDHPDFKPLRTAAKVFGFRLLYGGSAYGMFMDPNMPDYSLNQWEKIVAEYYEKYKRLSDWHDELVKEVYRNGTLTNPTGRQFTFYKFKKPNRKGEVYNHSQIKNYPVQSFATADIMPLAMCLINSGMKKRKLKSKLILQVHDSIVMDVKKEEIDVIARLCINVFCNLPKHIERVWGIKFNVPLDGDVEVGKNYGDLHMWKEAA
jgi:DNA polymerase I-like protein with 3'-5' exonuclease and polymerase domains